MSLAVMVLLTGTNLVSVRSYGEYREPAARRARTGAQPSRT
jgi:hypothetical protein